jgi:hypothetical protein
MLNNLEDMTQKFTKICALAFTPILFAYLCHFVLDEPFVSASIKSPPKFPGIICNFA